MLAADAANINSELYRVTLLPAAAVAFAASVARRDAAAARRY